MRSLIKEKTVRELVPKVSKYPYKPMVFNRFGKNIGHYVLNYNRESKAATFTGFADVEQLDWQCLNQEFDQYRDRNHGHVLTGDLSLIRNTELRNLMSKGAKFRENPRFSHEDIEIALHKDVDRFAEKWVIK